MSLSTSKKKEHPKHYLGRVAIFIQVWFAPFGNNKHEKKLNLFPNLNINNKENNFLPFCKLNFERLSWNGSCSKKLGPNVAYVEGTGRKSTGDRSVSKEKPVEKRSE